MCIRDRIALTYVLENDTAVFTRQLWEGSTECLVVFPDGVGILPWICLLYTSHIADKVRFVHAGCGTNALSDLQKFANSIDYRIHVGLIREAHQAFLLLSSVSG